MCGQWRSGRSILEDVSPGRAPVRPGFCTSRAPARSSGGNPKIISATRGNAATATLRKAFSSAVDAITVTAPPIVQLRSLDQSRCSLTSDQSVIPSEPRTLAIAWSDTLRAYCSPNSYRGKLCSKTASNHIAVAQGHADACHCGSVRGRSRLLLV